MASVTYWSIRTPHALDQAAPNELATGPIRDPLWMLARQWQLKEFAGDDAGSAIQVRYLAERAPVNTYTGANGTPSAFDELARPLESAVEAETVTLGLRGSVQLGLRFEAMLSDAQASLSLSTAALLGLIGSFRDAFPVVLPSADAPYDTRTAAYAALVAGSVTDGWALYGTAASDPGDSSIPAGASEVVASFVAWCTALYQVPEPDAAWYGERLTYTFGAAAQAATPVTMNAPDFPGGRLDWYHFDQADSSSAASAIPSLGSNLLPNVRPGLPQQEPCQRIPRWPWTRLPWKAREPKPRLPRRRSPGRRCRTTSASLGCLSLDIGRARTPS